MASREEDTVDKFYHGYILFYKDMNEIGSPHDVHLFMVPNIGSQKRWAVSAREKLEKENPNFLRVADPVSLCIDTNDCFYYKINLMGDGVDQETVENLFFVNLHSLADNLPTPYFFLGIVTMINDPEDDKKNDVFIRLTGEKAKLYAEKNSPDVQVYKKEGAKVTACQDSRWQKEQGSSYRYVVGFN